MDSKTRDDLCYQTSRWQRVLYDIEREAQPGLVRAEKEGENRAPSYSDFQREIFARFYNPRTPKLDAPAEGSEWAQELHNLAEQVAEFKVLQERTKGDEMWSGMATSTISKSVSAKMKKNPEGNAEQVEKLKQRVESLEDMANQGINVDKRIAKARRALQNAQEQAEALAKGLDPAKLRNAIREACDEAQSEISEAEETLAAFSYGDQSGTPMSKQNLAEKRALASRIGSSHRLAEIAKAAGRMRIVAAEKQRSKSNYARDEISSIEMGADVDRLLPNELGLLGSDDPDLEALFYARLAERKCLQYQLKGKEREGRGPLVICMDESGSMQGDAEVWSKAVAMALLDIAQRQKRSWAFIHFDRSVSRVDIVKAGQVDTAALMDCMEHFTGGGTSFEAPLDRAVKVIEEEGEFKKADILLVTDGCCSTSEGFNARFAEKVEQLDASVFSILVNGVQAGRDMAEWSDHIYKLEDILDGTERGDFEDKLFSI